MGQDKGQLESDTHFTLKVPDTESLQHMLAEVNGERASRSKMSGTALIVDIGWPGQVEEPKPQAPQDGFASPPSPAGTAKLTAKTIEKEPAGANESQGFVRSFMSGFTEQIDLLRGAKSKSPMEAARDNSSDINCWKEAVRAFAYTAVESPVKGIAELVDHTTGTHLADRVGNTFNWAPSAAALGSKLWLAQMVGVELGLGTNLLAIGYGVDRLLPGAGLGKRLARSAMVGLGEGLLQPVGGTQETFWSDKAANCAIITASFAAMGAAKIELSPNGLRNMARPSVGFGSRLSFE